jgi:hypothetical protein
MILAYGHDKSLHGFINILKKTKYQGNFPLGRNIRGKLSYALLAEIDAILKIN